MSKTTRALTTLSALALLAGAPTFAGPGDERPTAEKQQERRGGSRDSKQTVKKDKKAPAKGDRAVDRARDDRSRGGDQGKRAEPEARPKETRPTARPPSTQPADAAASPSAKPPEVSRPAAPDSAYKPSPTQHSAQKIGGTPQDRAPAHSAARAPTPTKVADVAPTVHVRASNYHIEARHRLPDHRYARPHHTHVHLHVHPHAHYHAPKRWWYRPYYTRWWVHPWYRWRYATVAVVNFTFAVNPWVVTWAPPPRVGFYWVPGYYYYGVWQPGYWEPELVQAEDDGAPDGYVWVPGWWEGEVYIEGYWRLEYRTDGDWVWVEGRYLDDGSYARAHWRPAGDGPDGYLWEPGFWDGETLVDGFWRPRTRSGFSWIEAYYDQEGLFNTGYWYPMDEPPGQVWIPGWFDGNEWIQGYWVDEAEYRDADIEAWEPEAGWDAGWEEDAPEEPRGDQDPLALPVDYP